MAKTVIGLLQDRADARNVIRELLQSGFRKKDIGIIAPEDGVRDVAKAVTKDMAKGAAVGALSGLVLAAATLTVPGFGPLLVAGPAAALLAGTIYGGLAGGIIGTLMSRGVPEGEAHAYAEGVRRGGTLITIHAQDDELAERAVRCLRRHGAIPLDERTRQWKADGWSGHFDQAPAAAETPAPELRAFAVYSVVLEMPERRRSREPYSGSERRKAVPA